MASVEEQVERRVSFLRDRQKGIGATDVPAILGLSSYRDALDVYHEKTRPVDPDDVREEVEAGATPIGIVRGRTLEPIAVREFFDRTGRRGRHEKERAYAHPDFPHVRVHSDGTQYGDYAPEGHTGSGTLEAKAPRASTFERLVEAGLDEAHVLQVQTELAARGHSWGSLAFYSLESSEGPLHAVDVTRNDALAGWVVETMERFWREHVDPRDPPDEEEWAEEIDHAPPIQLPEGDVIELDSPRARALAEKVNEAKELRDEGKSLYEDRREEMGEFLLEIGKVGIRVPGLGTYRWIERSGRLHLSKTRVKEAAPIDRDAFIRWVVGDDDTMTRIHVPAGADPEVVAEEIADRLALDVDRLCSRSSPSQYVGVYPKDS